MAAIRQCLGLPSHAQVSRNGRDKKSKKCDVISHGSTADPTEIADAKEGRAGEITGKEGGSDVDQSFVDLRYKELDNFSVSHYQIRTKSCDSDVIKPTMTSRRQSTSAQTDDASLGDDNDDVIWLDRDEDTTAVVLAFGDFISRNDYHFRENVPIHFHLPPPPPSSPPHCLHPPHSSEKQLTRSSATLRDEIGIRFESRPTDWTTDDHTNLSATNNSTGTSDAADEKSTDTSDAADNSYWEPFSDDELFLENLIASVRSTVGEGSSDSSNISLRSSSTSSSVFIDEPSRDTPQDAMTPCQDVVASSSENRIGSSSDDVISLHTDSTFFTSTPALTKPKTVTFRDLDSCQIVSNSESQAVQGHIDFSTAEYFESSEFITRRVVPRMGTRLARHFNRSRSQDDCEINRVDVDQFKTSGSGIYEQPWGDFYDFRSTLTSEAKSASKTQAIESVTNNRKIDAEVKISSSSSTPASVNPSLHRYSVSSMQIPTPRLTRENLLTSCTNEEEEEDIHMSNCSYSEDLTSTSSDSSSSSSSAYNTATDSSCCSTPPASPADKNDPNNVSNSADYNAVISRRGSELDCNFQSVRKSKQLSESPELSHTYCTVDEICHDIQSLDVAGAMTPRCSRTSIISIDSPGGSSGCDGSCDDATVVASLSLRELYTRYADVMYTTPENLDHTMKIQQSLFEQQFLQQKQEQQPRQPQQQPRARTEQCQFSQPPALPPRSSSSPIGAIISKPQQLCNRHHESVIGQSPLDHLAAHTECQPRDCARCISSRAAAHALREIDTYATAADRNLSTCRQHKRLDFNPSYGIPSDNPIESCNLFHNQSPVPSPDGPVDSCNSLSNQFPSSSPSSTPDSSPCGEFSGVSYQKSGADLPMEWVIKRRADGSRYVTRRPIRRQHHLRQATRLVDECDGLSTDEEMCHDGPKVNIHWSKDRSRRRHHGGGECVAHTGRRLKEVKAFDKSRRLYEVAAEGLATGGDLFNSSEISRHKIERHCRRRKEDRAKVEERREREGKGLREGRGLREGPEGMGAEEVFGDLAAQDDGALHTRRHRQLLSVTTV